MSKKMLLLIRRCNTMTRRKKRQKKLMILFIILGLIILASGSIYFFLFKKPLPKMFDSKPDDMVVEPEKKVKIIDEESKSRPYAIMINNNSAVWKYQSGLNEAYMIYEMLVEGGITREMALYRDANTEKIASIRSSRHYFLDYALENDAIYAHWGWSPKAQSDIRTLGINNINGLTYEGSYFFRDNSIKGLAYEHRGYTSMESLRKAVTKLNYRTTTDKGVLLKYDPEKIDLSEHGSTGDAKYIEVPYSSSYTAKFFYDEETGMYKKSQNKDELYDYTSKDRIVTKNIILYNVGYKTIDSKGRLDMQNTGSGNGVFITEGKSTPITWEKSSRSTKTIYKYEDGQELVVNDGSTYIGLMPSNKQAKISEVLP
ncbi:MAG TPA: DUF3048 domain-containing protein [Firmicutes bacterium]|nr:DUF3048 domain-containing protein [Bacillota bacterium]